MSLVEHRKESEKAGRQISGSACKSIYVVGILEAVYMKTGIAVDIYADARKGLHYTDRVDTSENTGESLDGSSCERDGMAQVAGYRSCLAIRRYRRPFKIIGQGIPFPGRNLGESLAGKEQAGEDYRYSEVLHNSNPLTILAVRGFRVVSPGIEPGTQGFSVLCSTI